MRITALVLGLTPLPALAQNAATRLVSANISGTAAQSPNVALSPDGRYAAFASLSISVAPGDGNGSWDVFLDDRVTNTREIVSLTSGGAQGHPLVFPAIWESEIALAVSRDARFVAFTSSAPDLVPGDTNGFVDVFVRDRTLGVTTLVSGTQSGAPSNDHAAWTRFVDFPPIGAVLEVAPTGISITPDGRFVAFASRASNLVPLDSNLRQDVFVRDLVNGTLERVSVSSSGIQGDFDSFAPSLSADGRFVAFQSLATNLVTGDTNQRGDVFVRDRLLGTTERVSVSSTGAQGDDHSTWSIFHIPPAICSDCPPILRRLRSQISADGRWVAFTSQSALLDPLVAGVGPYAYLHDRAAHTTRNLTPFADGGAGNPSVSANGRFVALVSAATNLGPADSNGSADVYRIDLALGTTTLESVDALGVQARGDANAVVLADDGVQLAFTTLAPLDALDVPDTLDAYARGAAASSFVDACEGTLGTCPCGNVGASGHGCASSAVADGARLIATGVPSVTTDTLVLTCAGIPTSAAAIFLQAPTSSPSAAAPTFGDGTLCLAGNLLRLRTRTARSGVAQLGIAGDPRVSALGAVPPLGATVHYQTVYRNAASFCTSATSNASNSIATSWTP